MIQKEDSTGGIKIKTNREKEGHYIDTLHNGT